MLAIRPCIEKSVFHCHIDLCEDLSRFNVRACLLPQIREFYHVSFAFTKELEDSFLYVGIADHGTPMLRSKPESRGHPTARRVNNKQDLDHLSGNLTNFGDLQMDKGEGFKETCAHFGAAMYFAQVLEHELANALVWLDFIPNQGTPQKEKDLESYYEGNFDRTLGKLISRLKNVSRLPSELETALQDAKVTRNFLAHRFFREREPQIASGCYEELIVELEAKRAELERTDRLMSEFTRPIRESHGITDEVIQNEVRRRKSTSPP